MKSIFLKSVLIISLLLQIAIYSANINYENYTRSQNNTVKKTKFAKTGSNISSERAKKLLYLMQEYQNVKLNLLKLILESKMELQFMKLNFM